MNNSKDPNQVVVAVLGLGYVGLPLAIEFGKNYETIGYDLSLKKINAYKNKIDPTGEVSFDDFKKAKKLSFSNNPSLINKADIIIVAVPTPMDKAHLPDFTPLIHSSTTVGTYMKKGAIVVYESTVYPGATEEICIPTLEKHSRKIWKKDFNVGYSPERVNPGDKERTITNIVKVVSGDNEKTLNILAELYRSIITAGVHTASSIKVAEAAKVIENTQRDLNIALMNELSIIFDKSDIDTLEVLQAAETKWNFLPFRPGLVGGHCIGVDPYYLTHKAEMLGYHPQVILAGRRINDNMASYVAQQTIKGIIRNGGTVRKAKIIVLGFSFKENCPDIRNSKVADLVFELEDFDCDVTVHDPVATSFDANEEYGVTLTPWEKLPLNVDAVVAAVSHKEYLDMPLNNILGLLKKNGLFVDVKSTYDSQKILASGRKIWRL